jgi:hypothetical protein
MISSEFSITGKNYNGQNHEETLFIAPPDNPMRIFSVRAKSRFTGFRTAV